MTHEIHFRAMGTDCHVIVVDGDPSDAEWAEHEVRRLEALWTRFDDSSEISRANAAAGVPMAVSPETRALARRALRAERLTGGRFDPLLGGELIALGYDRDHGLLTAAAGPTARVAMSPAVRQAGPSLVVDAPRGCITVPRGRSLDAGGIGKGLAADMVSAGLMRRGAQGALVNLGGDLRCRGDGPSGEWRVGIDHPDDPSLPSVARVTLHHGALCTSGVRKRRWRRADGTEAHHLLDPATGRPTDAEVSQVSVIAPRAWLAEALTKAVILAGPEAASTLLARHDAGAVVVLADGTAHRLP
jgi:thiamine biosynthesis lipoprotein